MKLLLIILLLLLSNCATTHTAIIYCKHNIDDCIKEELGDVKVIEKSKIDITTYMVDYK